MLEQEPDFNSPHRWDEASIEYTLNCIRAEAVAEKDMAALKQGVNDGYLHESFLTYAECHPVIRCAAIDILRQKIEADELPITGVWAESQKVEGHYKLMNVALKNAKHFKSLDPNEQLVIYGLVPKDQVIDFSPVVLMAQYFEPDEFFEYCMNPSRRDAIFKKCCKDFFSMWGHGVTVQVPFPEISNPLSWLIYGESDSPFAEFLNDNGRRLTGSCTFSYGFNLSASASVSVSVYKIHLSQSRHLQGFTLQVVIDSKEADFIIIDAAFVEGDNAARHIDGSPFMVGVAAHTVSSKGVYLVNFDLLNKEERQCLDNLVNAETTSFDIRISKKEAE